MIGDASHIIAREWNRVSFSELLAEPVRNGVYKPKEYHGSGVKMVNMGELFAYDFISDQDMQRIELTAHELGKSSLKKGDLLFARRSLILEGSGKCSIVMQMPETTTFESSIIRARLDTSKADPLFYFYFFKSPRGRAVVASIASRTAVSGIRGSDLVQLNVDHPPLDIQRQTAWLLYSYDMLIHNNLERIGILEEIAKTIFTGWFVRFQFPGHAEHPLIDDKLGKIPNGWFWSTVADAVELNPRTPVDESIEKPHIPMASLTANSMVIVNFEMRKEKNGSKFRNGDTLFARITPSTEHGKTAFVQFLPSNKDFATGSTEFIVMRSRTLNPYYVYFLARKDDLRQHAIKSMTGASGRQRVQVQCFKSHFFPHPDETTLKRFEETVSPIFRLVQTLVDKTKILRRQMDILLPKLISGELDVTDLGVKMENDNV